MTKITVLCGGVGAARFLRGLLRIVEPADITAIVNTADETGIWARISFVPSVLPREQR